MHAEPAERASQDLVDAPTATSAIHLAYARLPFSSTISANLSESVITESIQRLDTS